jgi:hypothetical protein
MIDQHKSHHSGDHCTKLGPIIRVYQLPFDQAQKRLVHQRRRLQSVINTLTLQIFASNLPDLTEAVQKFRDGLLSSKNQFTGHVTKPSIPGEPNPSFQ